MPTTFTTYAEARDTLDALNKRVWAHSETRPHVASFPNDVDGYVAAAKAWHDASTALSAEAKGHGFIRLFNGAYRLTDAQASLS